MEYRKLILFGKSSYVVSLPKGWVKQNKLKKGDLVYFEESGSGLMVQPRKAEVEEEEKEIIITVDGKSIEQVQRELVPAYINNFRIIVFRGKEVKQKASEIQQLTQNLIALEIMEQTTDKIMARDFLDMESISTSNLIRKMDTITRAMMEDGINTFKEDNYDSIMLRDKDVNRLSYLVFRVVKYGLQNQAFMQKKHGLDVLQLVQYQHVTIFLESIADEVKRIARYMRSVEKLPEKEKQEFEKLYREVRENYVATMKAYYTLDPQSVYTIADKKKRLIEACDTFFLRNKDLKWSGYLTDRLKRMISTVHRLGRLIYE